MNNVNWLKKYRFIPIRNTFMKDNLIKALDSVVKEIQSLSPIELREALIEASKSEFAQTIDILSHFTNTVKYHRFAGDKLFLSIPKENGKVPYSQKLLNAINAKEALSIKQPCLFPIDTNTPIRDLPVFSQTDGEKPPLIGLVSKIPYREEWHVLDNTYKKNKDD